jgi:hypothetical protein
MFEHMTAVQVAVYAVAGAGNLLLLIILIIVLMNWNSALIRASSRIFQLLTLFFISMMLSSSVLYAYVPSIDQSYICDLRPWFTCISIMGVLSGKYLFFSVRIRLDIDIDLVVHWFIDFYLNFNSK